MWCDISMMLKEFRSSLNETNFMLFFPSLQNFEKNSLPSKCRWKKKFQVISHYRWFDRYMINSCIRVPVHHHQAADRHRQRAMKLQQPLLLLNLHTSNIYPVELWINRCDHIVNRLHLFQFNRHAVFRWVFSLSLQFYHAPHQKVGRLKKMQQQVN